MLRIGPHAFEGRVEEGVGSDLIFAVPPAAPAPASSSSSSNSAAPSEGVMQFVGSTQRRLLFAPVSVEPREARDATVA